MQIERNEIRCFHAVVEAGGFSRAAERLDLSQSAVSQAIANLEHRLGAVLLRRGNPPQLTEAGIRLLRFAETVMNEERETLADIGQIKSGALSTLSLALSPAANARFGIALLREFSERNPLTRFKVVVAPSREIVYGVGDGRWELGFGPLLHTMPEYFAFHSCFSETRRLMIARNHPAREALLRDPQATLRTLPLITSYLDEPARRPSGDRLRNAFATVWEVSHMELRLALVVAGQGRDVRIGPGHAAAGRAGANRGIAVLQHRAPGRRLLPQAPAAVAGRGAVSRVVSRVERGGQRCQAKA